MSAQATLSDLQLGMLLVVIVIRRAEEMSFPVIWDESVLCNMVDVLARSFIPGEFYI